MRGWIRRLRGALGMGVTWAGGWALIGALYAGFLALTVGIPLTPIGLMWTGVKLFGALGFFSGSLFSMVLGVTDRRRRFDELSVPRFSVMGALGGALLGAGAISVWGFAGAFASAGIIAIAASMSAASAAITLVIARRSEDQALLTASDEVANIGLSSEETQELLGSG